MGTDAVAVAVVADEELPPERDVIGDDSTVLSSANLTTSHVMRSHVMTSS